MTGEGSWHCCKGPKLATNESDDRKQGLPRINAQAVSLSGDTEGY